MTHDAVRLLLDGLIDYAGLFPPAALPMADAVANYAAYRGGSDAWALARFVVPATRLDELAAHAPTTPSAPWRLSVLAQPADAEAIRAFNAAHAGRLLVDALECKAANADEVAALAPLAALATVYVEIPVAGDPGVLIAAIAAHGLRAKIRTGGVTADAFPSATSVARFLAACAARGVVFKATAGLHHPLRGEYPLTYAPDAARGRMYGFLNVFLAAILARQGVAATELEALLLEDASAAVQFSPGGVAWRGHTIAAASIADARAHAAASFGSCSFREPIDDLSALGLL